MSLEWYGFDDDDDEGNRQAEEMIRDPSSNPWSEGTNRKPKSPEITNFISQPYPASKAANGGNI